MMTLNNNYPNELQRSEIYSICGNRIVMYQVEMTNQGLGRANYLSNLCWFDGQRIADGVACLSPRDNYTRFYFFNPDGSFELVCGNALFAATALLSNPPLNILKIYLSQQLEKGQIWLHYGTNLLLIINGC